MQSEFLALQFAKHGSTNLKQEFEQTRIFNLNKYITKRARELIQTEVQKGEHGER